MNVNLEKKIRIIAHKKKTTPAFQHSGLCCNQETNGLRFFEYEEIK